MNPKPQKRHQAIVSFSKEHHFGLLLSWKIRNGLAHGVDEKRISDYLLYIFKEDILWHFHDEETLLFSPLPAGDLMIAKATDGHRLLKALASEIEQSKNDAALLIKFADELEEHIRYEERILFNYLQVKILPDELEKIEQRFSNNSRMIDEQWKDCFWEKNTLPNIE